MNDQLSGQSATGMLARLASVKNAESIDFVVTNPANEEPLITLVLAGPAHASRLDLQKKHKALISRAAEKARNPRKAIAQKYLEDGDEMEIDLLLAATLDWKGPHGEPATEAYDAAQMEATYRDPEHAWLRKQVLDKLADDADFINS